MFYEQNNKYFDEEKQNQELDLLMTEITEEFNEKIIFFGFKKTGLCSWSNKELDITFSICVANITERKII